MTLNEQIVAAALAALGYCGIWVVRSLKGISQANRRVVQMLNAPEWADTEEKKRQAAALICGGGK